MRHLRIQAVALAGLVAVGCASSPDQHAGIVTGPVAVADGLDQPIAIQKIGRPYQVSGRWYTPARQDDYNEVGQASWYGAEFGGRPTANGERFDPDKLTAAHPTLPIPSYVQVTNLDNGRTAILRVNDRGPFSRNRILDVSQRAAEELGFMSRGTANVRVAYLGPKENDLGAPPRLYTVSADVSPAPVVNQAPLMDTAMADLAPAVGPGPTAAPPPAIIREPMTRLPGSSPAPAPQPVSAPLVEAAPQLATVQPQSTLPEPGGWFVQAGAFAEQGRAESVCEQLSGMPSTIETITVAGQTLHRVLLGPYPAELAANAVRYEVASAGFSDARLVLRN